MKSLPSKKSESILASDQSMLQQKILQAKQDLQTVFDGITDGIAVIDRQHRIKRVNAPLLKLLGKKEYGELLGEVCCPLLHESDQGKINCSAAKVFKSGKEESNLRSLNIAELKDHIFKITTFPLKSRGGEVDLIVESYRDITKDINMERQLLELEKARNTGFLAAGVAHELRNPLAVISSSTQLCLADLEKISEPNLKKEFKENLEAIISNTESAEKIVKQLLDFSKPVAASFVVESLATVVDRVCHLVKNRCRTKEIQLVQKIPDDFPPVRQDPDALTHALLNFVTNAIDAISKNGQIVLEGTYKQGNDYLLLFVEDTGKGVPAAATKHLFEPFFTTKKEGVGLGMAIAQRIVNIHGGGVEFQSKENEGSTVKIKLPVAFGEF